MNLRVPILSSPLADGRHRTITSAISPSATLELGGIAVNRGTNIGRLWKDGAAKPGQRGERTQR